MSGESRARRLGFVFALAALACSPVRETRSVTVLERSERRIAERPAPELERTAVSVTRRDTELGVRVHREHRCWLATRSETRFEVHTTREPRTGWLIADLSMTATGLLLLTHGRSEDAAMDLSGWGIVLTGIGVPSTLIDLGKFSSDTREELGTGPIETELGRCSAPAPRRHRVTLVLEDGRSLVADTAGDGVARFPLTDRLWRDFGGRIDCDVYVDGVPQRRVVLERGAP